MINVEGIVLPNKPLTNFQLIDAVKKLKTKNFRSVFVRDELPKKPRKKECGIVNPGIQAQMGFIGYVGTKTGTKNTALTLTLSLHL